MAETIELSAPRAVSPTSKKKYLSLKEFQTQRRAKLLAENPKAIVEPVPGSPQEAAEQKVNVMGWINRYFIGYAKYDFVANEYGGVWGTHNNRKVELGVVEELIKSFKKGMHATDEDTAVPILLRRGWMEGTVVMDTKGRTIGTVPGLKLSKEGRVAAAAGKVCPQGGGHRRTAADLLRKQKLAEVEKIKGDLLKLIGSKTKAGKKVEKGEAMQAEINLLEREIESLPYFLLKVIDQGER